MSTREKYSKQLGMDLGTAQNQLKKTILFELVRGADLDVCFRCERQIDTPRELSIEHIDPWRNEPDAKELFFDLKNISFSHLSCNSRYQNQPRRGKGKRGHPTIKTYRSGCKCDSCQKLQFSETANYGNFKYKGAEK
jgi:hypothetical protein